MGLVAGRTFAAAQQAKRRPNVLFILADDLGWRDTSFTGSTFYETPNVERLAKRGTFFPNAYSASPFCSPTRASILTGLSPARVGITTPACHLPNEVLQASVQERAPAYAKRLECDTATRLKQEYYTLAEALKDAGYATGHFGKWHLGHEPYDPLHQGFDVDLPHWPGPSPAGSFVAPWKFPSFRERTPGEHIEDRMGDEAVAFMEAHKEQPFFLNYWQFSVHAPFNAKAELIEKYRPKVDPNNPQKSPTYAAMVQSLDDNVGKLLDALDRLSLAENTVIVFFSDNGGNMYDKVDGTTPTSNAPLRGGKGTLYEGGVRVPCFVVWPGVTRGGTTNESLVESTDFYPTLLEILGVAPRPDQHFDGVSIVPALHGVALGREVYCYFPHATKVPECLPPSVCVRKDDWKLIRIFHDGEHQEHRYELYNLKEDLGETNNLAERQPDRVRELDALIERFLTDTKAVVPKPNPNYRPGALQSVGGWKAGGNGRAELSVKDGLLHVVTTGNDPQFTTEETLNFPPGSYTFELQMKTKAAGNGQVFFAGPSKQVVPGTFMPVTVKHDGEWHQYQVEKEVKEPVGLIRLDPCSGEGEQDIEWMRVKKASGEVVREWRFGP
jgi:arylsulfatase A-like enzyme